MSVRQKKTPCKVCDLNIIRHDLAYEGICFMCMGEYEKVEAILRGAHEHTLGRLKNKIHLLELSVKYDYEPRIELWKKKYRALRGKMVTKKKE